MAAERGCPRNENVWRCWGVTATAKSRNLQRFVPASFSPARHPYPALSSRAIGCRATMNSAGIVRRGLRLDRSLEHEGQDDEDSFALFTRCGETELGPNAA